MNGQRQDQNTTFSSRKFSDFQTSGLNLLKSIAFFSDTFYDRITFGLVSGSGDVAVKLAAWQWIYGGTNSPQDFADTNTFKHLTCSIVAFLPTCWTAIPFENARRAYYADKTWPVELRKGYTSPTNALFRIPFEEGLSALFKNGFPIWSSAFVFWTGYCTFYSFIKNKYFFLWTYHDFSYNYIKAGNMALSFAVGSFLAYPFYFTREMVDIWPKERGGHCTWNNSYRQAAKFMLENTEILYFNFLTNYTVWFRRYGLPYMIALWTADNLGMFSNCHEAHASLESQFPIFSESS